MWKKIWSFIKNSTINLFKWCVKHLKDKHFRRIFYGVFLILSSEVWLSYILAFVFGLNTIVGKILLSVASAGLFFWNVVPCTPFVPICLAITKFIHYFFYKRFEFYYLKGINPYLEIGDKYYKPRKCLTFFQEIFQKEEKTK